MIATQYATTQVAARHQLQLLAALPTLATTQQHDKLALTAKLLLKTLVCVDNGAHC